MGRKTDVGVLSVYMTADTKDFSHALKKSGQDSKAWAVSIKSQMNILKGSYTELLSKISLMAQGLAFGFSAAASSAAGFKYLLSGATKDLEEFRRVMFSTPIAGEIFRQVDMMTNAVYDLFVATEKLTEAEERRSKLMTQALDNRRKMLEYEQQTAKIRREYLQETMDKGSWLSLQMYEDVSALELELAAARDKLDADRKAALEAAGSGDGVTKSATAAAYTDSKRQIALIEDRIKAVRALYEAKLDGIHSASRAETEARRKALQEEEQATRKSEELARQSLRRTLTDRMAAQVKAMESLGGWVGATHTVSTGYGSMKIADESQTRAIQLRQLEKMKEQTSILADIRQELHDAGGVLQ